MRKIFLFIVMSMMVLRGASADEAAPAQLPHVTPSMRTAGFWISQNTKADQEVMSEVQIKAFNNNVREDLKLTKDIFSLINRFQTESLADVFKKTIQDYTAKTYYVADGTQEDGTFIDRMKKNMHLSAVILGVEPRYGLIVSYADQRFLPTKEGLFTKKGDVDFDELQNSALDVGTAVAVVHQSLDGKWSYVLSALSDGWVETDKIAFSDVHQVRNFMEAKKFVVVTNSKTDIFLDTAMTRVYHFARMGNKFPLLDENDEQWVVQLPVRGKDAQMEIVNGYILKSQTHRGYLPFTPRTIYTEAFRMLDKPYGWGDMNGEQDCSRFLQMVYATVGLEFPRDSKDQAQIGKAEASFDSKVSNKEKLDALQKASGAVTILPMKGHIMLYLGMVNGQPFAIHETSGYSQTKGEIQVKYVLNRVVVSDLSLGENSTKGSLLRRLTKIVGIEPNAH